MKYHTLDGNIIEFKSRFRLTRSEDGQVHVLFAPKLKEADFTRFNGEQRERLLKGMSVIALTITDDGARTMTFYQLDPATRQVMSAPMPAMTHNIYSIAEQFEMNNAERDTLLQGDPVTIYPEDEAITIGVSLVDKCGIRIVKGEEDVWLQSSRREYQKESYAFGLNGCWVIGDDGEFAGYVKEEDYSDEIYNELKRQSRQETTRSSITR